MWDVLKDVRVTEALWKADSQESSQLCVGFGPNKSIAPNELDQGYRSSNKYLSIGA